MTRLATRWLLGFGLGLLAAVALLPGLAAAQPADAGAWPARVGRLAEVQGVVWLFDRDEGQWTQVQRNRPLTTGDRLSTERGARAELRIGSTTLRLDGDTDLSLPRLDDQAIAVELSTGSVALRVTARDVLSQIEITTAEGRFTPRATGHYRIDRRGEASEATTWRGALQFESHDSQLTITGGQHAELWQQGADRTTHYRLVAVERDEFADWVARDDRDLDRTEAVRHVSPEMTGWEDLDRYGRWGSHPEFGTVWTPSDVPEGWVPYRDGRWSWVSPWGWTWVDAAPWGFAPFHYGRWVRWGGRWVWSPGPRTHRPVFAPALVTWTFAPHQPDGRRPPPPSGWTPLSPRDVYRPHRPAMPPPPPLHDRVVPPAPWRGDRFDRGDRRPDPRPSPPRPNVGIEPARPVPYTPQGVPGGVTVVPRDVFTQPGTPSTLPPAPPPPQPPRARPDRPDRTGRHATAPAAPRGR
uniref:DUF6600 domain-containing protein n=1 Tax=Ideonella sp. A 288 TaxID=1962181 RepID=UPI003855D8D7